MCPELVARLHNPWMHVVEAPANQSGRTLQHQQRSYSMRPEKEREREDLFSRTGKSHKTERRIISEGHSPRLPSLLPDARPRCQRVTHTGGGSRSKNISSNFQQDEFPREVPSVCLSQRNRVIASRRAFYCSLFTCGSTCVESPSPLILSTTGLEH